MTVAHASDQKPDLSEGRWSNSARSKAEIIASLRGLDTLPADLLAEACRAAGKLLGKKEPASHQTIRNWLGIVEQDGIGGLERRSRSDKGKTNLAPEIAEPVRGWLLSPKKYTIAKVHRLALRYARRVLKMKEEDFPSYKQIEYIWDNIPDDEKLLAREGVHAYREARDIQVRFEAEHANDLWQGDHHLLDIIVVDPDTGEDLGRPWISKFLDDRSRAICGYHLSLDDPASISIALALRHAMLPKNDVERWPVHGVPKKLLIDNGKDWRSRHIGDAALHFGIELHYHEPYHPQSKGKIERIFRTLEEMCIHDQDGYVGSNPQKRPRKVTPKLTLEQLRVEIEQFILDYNQRRHGTTKAKPADRWLEDARHITPVDEQRDLNHLLKSGSRKVRADGIHFDSAIYKDDVDYTYQKHIGQWVAIYFNPRNLNDLHVYGREGGTEQYLFTAVRQSKNPTQGEVDTIQKKNQKRQQELQKSARKSQKKGDEALKALKEAEALEKPATGEAPVTLPPTEPDHPQPPASNETDEPSEAELEALRRKMQYRYKSKGG